MPRRARRIAALIAFLLLVACTLPDTVATVTPAQTATPTQVIVTRPSISPTPPPEATPTSEHVDDAEFLDWYRVIRTVNVRTHIGTGFPILYQLEPGTVVLALKTDVNFEGIWWLWIINNCHETLPATGYAAQVSETTTWLEHDPTLSSNNC